VLDPNPQNPATNMNPVSSRSHAVLVFRVVPKNKGKDDGVGYCLQGKVAEYCPET